MHTAVFFIGTAVVVVSGVRVGVGGFPSDRAVVVVEQGDALRLDGDAALALDREPVEVLLAAHERRDRADALHEAIRERGFAVVDVRDDGECAHVLGRDREVLRGAALRREHLARGDRLGRRAGLARRVGAAAAARGGGGARRRGGGGAEEAEEVGDDREG